MAEDPTLATAQMFAAVGRDLIAADGVAETLSVLVHLATVTIPGCDHAAVTLVSGRSLGTPAASDDIPRRVDAIQYETNEGPCLDAVRSDEQFVTGDLAEEGRWPHFSARAAEETGVHSMLSLRLFVEAETMGALNLYSSRIDAFSEVDIAIAVVFAAHASIALKAAQSQAGFERALKNRDVIGQAKGILIERRKVTAKEAFAALRRASQQRNVKLVVVADEVVETGRDPEAEPGL